MRGLMQRQTRELGTPGRVRSGSFGAALGARG